MVEAEHFLHLRSNRICLFRFNNFRLLWLHSIIIGLLLLLIVGKVHCVAFVVQRWYWQFECWQDTTGDARPPWLAWICDEGIHWLLVIRWWANCHFWCLYSHVFSVVELVILCKIDLAITADERTVFVNEKGKNVVWCFSRLVRHHESAASCLCLIFCGWHMSNEGNNGQIAVTAGDPLVFSSICWNEV